MSRHGAVTRGCPKRLFIHHRYGSVLDMRIFVGEFVCGGGLAGTSLQGIPVGLCREGAAMLRAIVSDLAEVADTVAAVDPRLISALDGACSVEVDAKQSVWAQWMSAAEDCDAALIVAPESGGVLAKAVAMLRAGGVDVIAGSGDFLRVAGDKILTAKAMHAAGVAHPLYMGKGDRRFAKKLRSCDRFVVKPRDGCGTQEIRLFDSFGEAEAELTDELILQGWVPGRPVSIALVASGSQQTFLPVVSQNLSEKTCEYAGGCGPLGEDDQRRAMAVASRAISAMPPTARGFVGLDLVLGTRPSEDCVIEINARLTTSYVGLRQMITGNLAARLFDLETGPMVCNVGVDSVRWTPDGQVWVNDVVASGA